MFGVDAGTFRENGVFGELRGILVLGIILGPLGLMFAQLWNTFGQLWAQLGQLWAQHGPKLAPSGAELTKTCPNEPNVYQH